MIRTIQSFHGAQILELVVTVARRTRIIGAVLFALVQILIAISARPRRINVELDLSLMEGCVIDLVEHRLEKSLLAASVSLERVLVVELRLFGGA